MEKRGQMEISFGMIFSIVLIIIFLAAGFYGITQFLNFQKTVQIDQFISNFQADVNNMWKSPEGSQTLTYTLPTEITAVCFESNNSFQNMEFTSTNFIQGSLVQNINIANITATENPYCIPNSNGQLNLTIVKDYGETLVRVTR